MKKLHKSITLAVVGTAFCLGLMATSANAQFGRRGGFSINVSLGSHRVYRPRYSSYRVYTPVVYRTRRPVYISEPRNSYYYDSGYYRPASRYIVSRSYGRSRSSCHYRRY